MFKHSHRLKLKKDIDNVFKNGRSSFTVNLGVKAVVNRLNENRFTVIIGKKTHKNAVKRNLLKRRARAILKKVTLKPGFDIIVLFQKNIELLKSDIIEKELRVSLKRLKILDE
jgi:ribonuclease P protein component